MDAENYRKLIRQFHVICIFSVFVKSGKVTMLYKSPLFISKAISLKTLPFISEYFITDVKTTWDVIDGSILAIIGFDITFCPNNEFRSPSTIFVEEFRVPPSPNIILET